MKEIGPFVGVQMPYEMYKWDASIWYNFVRICNVEVSDSSHIEILTSKYPLLPSEAHGST
jgi:hypothetical protein